MAVGKFRVRRIGLTGGQKTPITAPMACNNVSIGNATAGDLEVHTTDANDDEYLVIAAGYERAIALERTRFDHEQPCFWLKPAQSGTAVLLWY